MKQVRIYQNSVLIPNQSLVVDAPNQSYLTKVLRLRNGFKLTVFNGDGFDYRASLSIDKKCCTLTILSKHINSTEINTQVRLAQAIAKGDKMDSVIQKATELGVHHIVPLITERVVVKLNDNKQLARQAHWQKIAISACEQCGRSIVPLIAEPVSLATFLNTTTCAGFVLTQHADKTLKDYPIHNEINVLIGPEGGLTEDEIALATHHHHAPLALGKTTLRTETAGMAVLAQLNLLWG